MENIKNVKKSLEAIYVKDFEKNNEDKMNENIVHNKTLGISEEKRNENIANKNIIIQEHKNVNITDINIRNEEKGLILHNSIIKNYEIKADANKKINTLSKIETLPPIDESENNNIKKFNLLELINKKEINRNDINAILIKDNDENNSNLIRDNKRKIDDKIELYSKKLKDENIESCCELSLSDENNIQSSMKKIKDNFNIYWKECEFQLKELQNCYVENEKLIKETFCENNSAIHNKNIGGDEAEETKEKRNIEKRRKILSNIMNIRLIYRIIEMCIFAMRQFSYLLKENSEFISLILDEHKIIKNNYEMVIGNLIEFKARNYEDIKYSIERKVLCMDEFFKNKDESIYSRDDFSHLYTLKCLQHEISQRVDTKTDLRLLMIKKREYAEKFMKENERKIASYNKLSSFKKSINCLIDKYSSLDLELSKYLSTFYCKLFNHQIEMNINKISILNNKKPFNFLFNFKEQNNINDVFNYMNYEIFKKIRKNDEHHSTYKEFHSEYIIIKFHTVDNLDISILPDSTYLNYLNIEIEISYLYNIDCLVAKANSIDFLRLYNGNKLLSDIYSNQDHFLLFSNDASDFYNFKYGFPFLWLNAMAEKPYTTDIESEISQKEEVYQKAGNDNNIEHFQNDNFFNRKLSDIYSWHLNRNLDISVLFSKIFTRILFRIWDIWQIRHYKYYPNVFPPFTYEKHLEALKKIQSVSLQQISYFDIITEESYLKEENENTEACSEENIYACCFIHLYESCLVKAFINVPFNGKEPYFSVFLTKKKYSRRLKKLQDYLNTTVVNKHSKVEDTQRQIILTLQLAKLREGAHKYFKSFSKNSTPTFDEEIS